MGTAQRPLLTSSSIPTTVCQRVPSSVGRTLSARHDQLGRRAGRERQRAERHRAAARQADLVVDLDGGEGRVGVGQRHPQGHAAPGEAEAIAFEQQVARGEEIDVGVEPAGGGLHERVPVISCAIPPDNATRSTSVKPAACTIASSSPVSGRYATDFGR